MEQESELMKAWRDFAMADPEDCDREWDAYLALVNRKETAPGSSPTTSTSPLHHRPRASSAGATAPSATTRSAAPLRAPGGAVSTMPQTASSSTSTRNLKPATSSVASASSDLNKDDLSPGARRVYDYLVGATSDVSTVLHPPPEVEDVLVASVPTTCSVECPSHDASVYAAALIPSATPNSSTTSGIVVPELSAPEASDKAVDMDVMGDTAPMAAICLSGTPDHNTGGDDPVAMLLTPWSATPSLIAPPENSPTTVSADLLGPAVCDLLEGGNNLTLHPPWPPPGYVIMCKDMVQAMQLDGFIFESVQLMLWAAKTLWHPPFPNRSACIQIILQWDNHTCRITNLRCTMDTKQKSGDKPVSRTVAFECNAILTVTIFALGVQCTQLQPTAFKWTDQFCHDTHSLIASTSMDMLLDLLLVMQADCTPWTWCCLDNVHYSLGSTNWALEEQVQVLLPMPWPSFMFFSTRETWDCLQYEHLQQWRPPDQTTEFLGVQLQWKSRNMCSITLMTDNVPAQLLEVYNMLCRLTSNHFQAELFVIEHWLIPWDPGDDSPGHNLMEFFTSLAITCELLYSVSVDDNFLADRYRLWCMKCVELDTDRHRNSVPYLRPKPPWPHFAPSISASEFMSNISTVSKSLHNISNSFELNLLGVAAWHLCCARFRPPGAYFLLVDVKHINNREMSCGNYPPPSADLVQLCSQCFFCTVQYPDGIMGVTSHHHGVWISHEEIISRTSASVGQDCKCETSEWEFSIHIWQGHEWVAMSLRIDGFQEPLLGGYITVGCFRSARNNESVHATVGFGAHFRATETLLLPWDPSDCSASAWRQRQS